MTKIPKFRAWYSEKMYELAKIDLWGDPEQATCDLASLDFGEEELFDIYLHEVELMQFTGLYDKYGKEIYEGDVVRTHFSFGHEVTQEPFVIKWNKERAMFEGGKPKPLENDYLATFSFFPEQRFLYEIIGNIYENPEWVANLIDDEE